MKETAPSCLMTPKEKSYVAHCFSKIANIRGSTLDYEKLFNGEKNQYSTQRSRKEAAFVFGKQSKRSKKWLRASVSGEAPALSERLVLCDLFEINAVMAHIHLDPENLLEMEQAAVAFFTASFSQIISIEKTFDFLASFWQLCTDSAKAAIIGQLVEKSREIGLSGMLYAFLDACAGSDEALRADLPSFLLGSDSGLAVGLWMLKHDAHVDELARLFRSSSFTASAYAGPFAEALLAKDLPEAAKAEIRLRAVEIGSKREHSDK
ncbi:hypothetical protein PAPHI01_0754 [Pancytospora philotis]|nr:hypothetical protein PAPHI01_0754 [Pancytospora philotis]